MAVNPTIHYELASPADLRKLVGDLGVVDASTVVVGFHPSAEWAPTDLEIARLVAVSRTTNCRLIVERSSGHLAERAVRLGFQDMAVVTDGPAVDQQTTSSLRTTSEAPTSVIPATPAIEETEQPTVLVPVTDKFQDTSDIATYRPLPANQSASEDGQLAAGDSGTEPEPQSEPASESPTAIIGPLLPDALQPTATEGVRAKEARKTTRANSPKPRASERVAHPPTPIGRVPSGDQRQSAPFATATAGGAAPPPRHERKWNRGVLKISAAILAPILVLGLIGGLAIYTLPTATVTIVPQEESISSTLTYGVASTSTTFDITIDPDLVTTTTTAQAQREATGERFEAVGTAGGTIQITNPLTHEVTVPAGTEIPGPQGVMYYTAEDVRLPAADPYGSMSFGYGNVGVYAGVVGPDGNIEAGLLTGQLGTQMFYTNPEGISGGRTERYSVLTEDDVETVRESVASELDEKAREEFDSEIPEGFEIVPGTLDIGDPEIEVSGSAGEDGQQVSASGSITIEAYVYDPTELHDLAGDEADRQLARQGGSERILLAETVTLKEPTDLGNGEPAFQINVEAIARTVITEAEKEQLLEDVTGISREEAEAILRQHPKIDRHEISIEPNWLLDRMPEISSRISIHVSSSEQTASR